LVAAHRSCRGGSRLLSSADFHNVTRSLLPPWNGMFSLAKINLNLKPPIVSRVRLALCNGGDLLGVSGLNKASYSVDGIEKLRTKPWHPTSAARRELRRTSFFQLAYVQYSLYRCKSTPNAHPMIPKCRRAGLLSRYKLSLRYNAFLISMMLRDIRCPSPEKKTFTLRILNRPLLYYTSRIMQWGSRSPIS